MLQALEAGDTKRILSVRESFLIINGFNAQKEEASFV
jgi:hypothetical protein